MENFGPKIVTPKILFAELPKLFQHRDKTVRGATKDFFVESYCWVGASIKTILEKTPKIEQSIKECEEAWKDKKSKVCSKLIFSNKKFQLIIKNFRFFNRTYFQSKQKRFFKRQVELREKAEEAAENGEEEEEEEAEEVLNYMIF